MRFTARLRIFFATLAVALALLPAASAAAAANSFDPFQYACTTSGTANSPACQATGQDPVTGKEGILYKTSKILALFAAIGAIIIMMVGGLMYITSGGDSNRATKGRQAMMGAGIGLAVIALSSAFVAFVINVIK